MKTSDAIRWGGGTQAALAKRLGIQQASVATWGEYPPPLRQMQMQILSAGQLLAEPECYMPQPQTDEAA